MAPGRPISAVFTLFSTITREGSKDERSDVSFAEADNGIRKQAHIRSCIKCLDDIKFRFLEDSAEKMGLETSRRKK